MVHDCFVSNPSVVTAVIVYFLPGVREKRTYYENHPEEVERIIKEGSERARLEAQKVLAEVRKLVRMY